MYRSRACPQLLCLLLSLLLLVFLLLGSTHAVFFFAVIHNADASSSDIDPHVSGRSPQTSRICNGACVSTDVSTDQDSPEPRNIAHVSPQPGNARSAARLAWPIIMMTSVLKRSLRSPCCRRRCRCLWRCSCRCRCLVESNHVSSFFSVLFSLFSR